jgi:predicted ATPase/DNA-binding winged helix-turn-helix (wHTH) protein
LKQFESFRLDTSNQCLWHRGEQIALPPKPFAVLRYLVENPGRLITHDELLDALWPETYVQPQVLRTYMLELRKVLNDDAGKPRFILTLPKRGYRFVALVKDWSGTDWVEPDWVGIHEVGISAAPAAMADSSRASALVDRVEELARLKAQFDLSAAGQRRVVFVTGEAGIGKTALVDAFFRRLVSSASVARGQCVEGFGGKEEYYPVMEALGQLCASPDGERACRILARIAPVWLAALGRGSETTPPFAAQQRMPGDLCAAFEELAAEKPLILVFEDVHWADDSTLHLISALARRRAAARLMILVTYRPRHGLRAGSSFGSNGSSHAGDGLRDELHDGVREQPLTGLKQDLLLRRLCVEITLAPLSKKSVKELLSKELKQEMLPSGLASFVHQRSEGNPLFIIAILEHLTAQRFLVRDGAHGQSEGAVRWEERVPFQELELEMEASVPDGLAQMIELEIERLSQREQRLLEAGSLISIAFPAWAVAAALEEDVAETEEACDALARRLYFVQRAGQDELPDGTRSAFYVFAHELYREVLYRRQTATRRARRHIRVAEKLRKLFAEREASVAREMAMHYEAAGEWKSAAQALRVAANHARQRHADAEAAELLEHGLRVVENLSEADRTAAACEMRDELVQARDAAASGQKTLGKA